MVKLIFGYVFLILIISGIFSFFEIAFIRIFFEIKSTKYIKLLKILDSYENYLLYKAFYSKILAASSIKLHRSETLAKSLKEK